jgi:hypothetical protein
MWPAHEGHSQSQEWFSRKSREGWATCPFTQAAFVRVISNPAFSRDAVTPQEAVKILEANLKHPAHQFWAGEISFVHAAQRFGERITGHQQLTDAYLLGLTIHKKGKLATMDRAVLALLAEKSRGRDIIELI